ncbi:Helix-turn-helix domain-containing protein [Thermomonospora echinospora]|jgi:Helix-turn-helix domain|uniref:Helix-turn-helix domain-containing protein n=1 Tax=Thermomonospora echinospora TaxID=1992 RepID=A0A1H6E682_9ACTN|nr:helix-turn-helix domain-containing protein [Thermomonospora echinospora]SEG92476.1 Helix-turn-helix domain-containing protein [Thermomonospora echinospora]
MTTADENHASAELLLGGWYTTEQLAEIIGVDPSTLRRWRTSNPVQGPPFVRMSGAVTRYSVLDVERWLANRRIDPREADT